MRRRACLDHELRVFPGIFSDFRLLLRGGAGITVAFGAALRRADVVSRFGVRPWATTVHLPLHRAINAFIPTSGVMT
jgi:hypothetical protein